MSPDLPYELDRRPVAAVVISSQLAFGSVGNTVIGRMIERAGHRVVCIPTVMFSNLPHYPSLAGGALDDGWLGGILDDLLARAVLGEAKFVCVGYLAHPGQARIIGEWFSRVREINPGIQLVVDPAMGDEDVGLYTAPEVVDGYVKHLIPLAGAVTPNNFELGLLTEGRGGHSPEERARSLLTPTLRWVAVTSAAPSSGPGAATVDTLLVTDAGTRLVKTPLVESRAKGAGDCFLGTTVGALLNGCGLEEAIAAAASATARALAGEDPYFSRRPPTA
ncbi:bifunctional hydroxymethylpyrimidine kinase/phosphomethylpyrimidine kinase [Paeniglutamicibacter psychrophenolicus]|uniref:bifunctional hydroxymethylpyrimidine kinase/phosphomethylpyrimidine kinase n=1 Tax=Paeniglutamicibacter psychrophenolicus TaxID=257454 RepID=UPI0027899A19|nr:bifunctional hydroxymethylpyrimidine kinase/phosphomethylpyrimidine kinase [Paeniglutamicibacter psychrophenolicus]MDQ0093999.1 pyridoxine kinase [Paeniglutamicibacter psychrophenolicus]